MNECSGCNEKADVGNHTFDENICTICGYETEPIELTDSTFILTDIPSEYNGMYAVLYTVDEPTIYGCDSISDDYPYPFIGSLITNGIVKLPMWEYSEDENEYYLETYTGNDTHPVEEWGGNVLIICNSQEIKAFVSEESGITTTKIEIALGFESITFLNGGVIKSWNDGQIFYDYD